MAEQEDKSLLDILKERGEKAKQNKARKEANYYLTEGGYNDNPDIDRDTLAKSLRESGRATRKDIDKFSFEAMREGKPDEEKALIANKVDGKERPYLTERGMRHVGAPRDYQFLRNLDLSSNVTREEVWRHGLNEALKDQGKNLWNSPGVYTGFAVTKTQLEKATFAERVKYAAGTLADTSLVTAAGRDMLLGNAGWLSRTAKIQMLRSNIFSRTLQTGFAIGPAALGLYAANDSENPANSLIVSTLAGTSLQAGWRYGKALGSVVSNSTLSRVAFGAPTAALSGLSTWAAIAGIMDLGSNDSRLVGAAKKFSTKEAFSFTPDSKVTATMRQRALQKLSSSSMNSRGQLLGNEAMILRGAPMVV